MNDQQWLPERILISFNGQKLRLNLVNFGSDWGRYKGEILTVIVSVEKDYITLQVSEKNLCSISKNESGTKIQYRENLSNSYSKSFLKSTVMNEYQDLDYFLSSVIEEILSQVFVEEVEVESGFSFPGCLGAILVFCLLVYLIAITPFTFIGVLTSIAVFLISLILINIVVSVVTSK